MLLSVEFNVLARGQRDRSPFVHAHLHFSTLESNTAVGVAVFYIERGSQHFHGPALGMDPEIPVMTRAVRFLFHLKKGFPVKPYFPGKITQYAFMIPETRVRVQVYDGVVR